MSQEEKIKIREYFFNKRLNLSSDYIQTISRKICVKAINYLKSQEDIKNIALYCPINNEVKLDYLIEFLRNNNYQIFLPKIIDQNLRFGKLSDNNLKTNPKISQILEPIKLSDQIMDLVFCPLVAFDKNNNRIGMGGGFYDRLIKQYHEKNYHSKFIGLAFLEQLSENKLPMEKFDRKLDDILFNLLT